MVDGDVVVRGEDVGAVARVAHRAATESPFLLNLELAFEFNLFNLMKESLM